MISMKYLYEVQFSKSGLPGRGFLLVEREEEVAAFAEKYGLVILMTTLLASSLGDPFAKGREVGLFCDVKESNPLPVPGLSPVGGRNFSEGW